MPRPFELRIPAALRANFRPAVRSRGEAYWRDRRVSLLERGPRRVRAYVRGESTYETLLTCDSGKVEVGCTCPYGESFGGACKHLWATVLEGALHVDFRDWFRDERPRVRFEAVNAEPLESRDEVEDEDEEALASFERGASRRAPEGNSRPANSDPDPEVADWRRTMAAMRFRARNDTRPSPISWPAGRRVELLVDVARTIATSRLHISPVFRDPTRAGGWGPERRLALGRSEIGSVPDGVVRESLQQLFGVEQADPGSGWTDHRGVRSLAVDLTPSAASALVPALARTGALRLALASGEERSPPLAWSAVPYRFVVAVRPAAGEDGWAIEGLLRRESVDVPLARPPLLLAGSLVFFDDHVAPLEDGGAFAWISALRLSPSIHVPRLDAESWLGELFDLPRLPPIELPAELEIVEERVAPRPGLAVRPVDAPTLQSRQPPLALAPWFTYGAARVDATSARRKLLSPGRRVLHPRDETAESAALSRLAALGAKPAPKVRGGSGLELLPGRFVDLARTLLAEGWDLEAEGAPLRRAGATRLAVRSHIDWFEVSGEVEFGDGTASILELLAASRRRAPFVRLSDGSLGLLPEEWLARHLPWLELGETAAEALRFRPAQATLVAGELDRADGVDRLRLEIDAGFRRLRDRLLAGAAPAATEAPAGFRGTLRDYQRHGLGWLRFLADVGIGGCLADDMGLGKTVQILALLAGRKRGRARRPSLVVAPRSLLFNWRDEAERFAPRLRLAEHHGTRRAKSGDELAAADLVLTTYDILRRDVELLAGVEWDVVVLDEAQAIKNEESVNAKSARRLAARLRIASTGTPVENHLGDLRSLLDFLNPGLFARSSLLRPGAGASGLELAPAERERLSRALAPFVLRRTKAEVAPELPPRTEQTLYCELDGAQKTLYERLRDGYRRSLGRRIREGGIGRARMHVLEALLRLRQAACHSALVDRSRPGVPSAKLELLLPRLAELVEEGNRALVFSQFTSLLALVRGELDRRGLRYAYLDGKTKDRAAVVADFAREDGPPLFLVSLKAGGTGLNLTAAGYAFLLDPWWNPAIEAQAIDRAHRIGQDKPVFAYRLIARGTVEEKILELQARKRGLADAILAGRSGPLSTLAPEDLEFLLS